MTGPLITPGGRPYRAFQPVYRAVAEGGRGGSTGRYLRAGLNAETGQGQYVLANGVVNALSHIKTTYCLLSIYGTLDWSRYPPKEGEPDQNGGVWRNFAGKREGITTADIIRRMAGDPQLHINTPTRGGYGGPHTGPDPALAQAFSDMTGIPWAEVWAIQVRPVRSSYE